MKPETYINKVLKTIRDEWKPIPTHIRDLMLRKHSIVEAIGFTNPTIDIMDTAIASILTRFIGTVEKEAEQVKQQAEIDSQFRIRKDTLGVLLTAEGLATVLSAIDTQVQFVDDFSLSTRERVRRLASQRYAALTNLDGAIKQTFRIDRDELIENFQKELTDIATSFHAGRIDSLSFQTKMMDRIGVNYRRIYREAKGSPLTDVDLQRITAHINTQRPFVNQFALSFMDDTRSIERATQRAGLYAKRGTALYEAGFIAGQPDDISIFWRLGVAEHCDVCPGLASQSPYTPATLPTLPGQGDTPCLTQCKCFLEVN